METLDDILDIAKENSGIRSDGQLALRLGIAAPNLSRYRKRHQWPSDAVAIQLAHLAGMAPARVLAILHAERSETAEVRETWLSMAANLVLVLAFSAVLAMLPAPAHAGPDHRHHVTLHDNAYIHYATLGLATLTAAILAYALHALGLPIAHP